jgi:hypothetical protein
MNSAEITISFFMIALVFSMFLESRRPREISKDWHLKDVTSKKG